MDPDGDTALTTWTGDTHTFSFAGGTGKYKGITGGGPYKGTALHELPGGATALRVRHQVKWEIK